MDAPEIVLNVVFYVLAAGAVAGAVAVATSKNIVRSAFSLLAVLFSAAALYAVMKADFIAASQVLIYVGGILVLIIFAVMLTHKITDVKLSNDSTPGPAAFCACLCLLFSLVVVVLFTAKWKREAEEVRVSTDGTEVFLRQYQADGTTGIARGGYTFEEAVVLAVRVGNASRAVEQIEVNAVSVRDSSGPRKNPVKISGSAAVVKGDVTRITLGKDKAGTLPEGEWTWTLKLKGADWESPEVSAPPGKVDFMVSRGVTEPIARALAGPYLFAFEAVSVLLLAALIGAAFLARKEVKES